MSAGPLSAATDNARSEYELALIDAIRRHPEIQAAVLTGSWVIQHHRLIKGDIGDDAQFAAAWDMIICLCRKRNGVSATTELLDARRRIETEHPALAAAPHRFLFGRPGEGVTFLVEYLQALLDG